MWISYEPWRRAAAVARMGFCGDYQLKDKQPLLIGPAKSMPLPCFNRLHAWNYTCPMMDSRVSHYLLGYFRATTLIWSDWRCNGERNSREAALSTKWSHDGVLQTAAASGLCQDSYTPAVQQICPDGLSASVHSSGMPQESLLHAQWAGEHLHSRWVQRLLCDDHIPSEGQTK